MAELAARQHGVVSASQLADLGYQPKAISRASQAGRLHRIHRGAYAVGHARLSPHGRQLAAVLACAPGAFLSHDSAGWLWGLLDWRPGSVHVTTISRRHRKSSIRMHRAPLIDEDMATRDGIPVTAVPRNLLDLAATRHRERVPRLVERAEALELFDLAAVDSVLGRFGGHRGAGRLRHAVELYRPPAFTRSQLERRFLDLVREAGLPVPAMNVIVAGYELDAYWERERFAVELDVFETHGTRGAFERDRLRQENLKLSGVEMVRITGRRLDREPDAVIESVGRLLARRRTELRR